MVDSDPNAEACAMTHPTSAHFLSLSLEGVRCFGERQTLDLSDGQGRPARWTVILGPNGSGKTTLLQAIAQMAHKLIPFYSRDSVADDADLLALARDPSKFELTAEISLESTMGDGDAERRSYVARVDLVRNVVETEEAFETKETDDDLRGAIYPDPLCIAYGATRRMGTGALSSASRGDATASLFRDDVALINAEEWLLQKDYAARASETTAAQESFDRTREVLVHLLPDVSDLRVAGLNEKRPRPRIEAKTPFGWVPLQRLSLGYRTLIAWMVDLAHRLEDWVEDMWGGDPFFAPAVVLVDEIDLHLHPAWQRSLMGYLLERFPNTQFIVTAHSPLMAQAAAEANLVVLRQEGDHIVIDNNPATVRGWRVDQILTSDLFGLPSPWAAEHDAARQERTELLSKPKLSRADKGRLQVLERRLGELRFGADPQEIEARDIILRFAERLRSSEP